MQSNVVSFRPEDDLGRYLDQARRHPMLAPERELDLARAGATSGTRMRRATSWPAISVS